MVLAYLGIGSNLGQRKRHIERAIEMLKGQRGITVTKVSSLIQTKPVGGLPQGDFLNGALEIETDLPAKTLLKKLKEIERRLGRKDSDINPVRDLLLPSGKKGISNGVKWGPRIIDLDILLFDNQIIESQELRVPHPFMHSRLFVLEPLNQIAPEAKHPILNKTVKELLSNLKSLYLLPSVGHEDN